MTGRRWKRSRGFQVMARAMSRLEARRRTVAVSSGSGIELGRLREVASAAGGDLATGVEEWADALASGRIAASGTRADLAALLPLRP